MQSELCSLLMKLDEEFEETTASDGLEGWLRYFDEEGKMIPAQGKVIQGKEAIRTAMEPSFSRSQFALRWKPEYAEVSEDGSLGYTFGSYLRTYLDENGEEAKATGRYTTVWKRQKDNSYKIILDIGN